MNFSIHIFDNPAEVYVVGRWGVDRFYWLAFGISQLTLPGSGLWCSAIGREILESGNAHWVGISIGPDYGGQSGTFAFSCSAGIFWRTVQFSGSTSNTDTIHDGFDGAEWAGTPSSISLGTARAFNAITCLTPLPSLSPSAWNQEAVLLPIQPYVWRASSKCSLVADLGHARYVRIDNYEPEQIVELGGEFWKVYPFHRKNSASRDGGAGIGHTGTFGWAIRVEGAE
jgi:hypothetical protein